MNSVKRIAALGLVLLAGACSRLPNVPTAYSALPRTSASGVAAAVAPVTAAPEAPAEMAVDLPRIVIPGTMTVPVAAVEPRGLNPSAALDTSRRSRMTWEALHPGDLLNPSAGRSASSGVAPRTYDREAMMDRLLKGGRNAASGICTGC
ncbi:hypothetical protein MKL09_09520 [Methylobacterium sp. J-048]|uniref:hypothetical protein n=1 Tax=Methylobacterium sp. J-048 TaxID=2836635 RepID=UPI001FB9511F|nr:hypothetical protein [Methylobacterium sp. J-048]MCJ2056794.1 hypothetical protein [Methylobacterium sp. J-048]